MTDVNKTELRRLLEAENSAWERDLDGEDETWSKHYEELHDFLGSDSIESIALSLMNDCDKAESERDAALAELEACRKDAARYRWLRDKCHLFEHYRAMKWRQDAFEKEVDAAMSQEANHA